MLGSSFSAPGTYIFPPGNMKSAWVSTAHKTRPLNAMPFRPPQPFEREPAYTGVATDYKPFVGEKTWPSGFGLLPFGPPPCSGESDGACFLGIHLYTGGLRAPREL